MRALGPVLPAMLLAAALAGCGSDDEAEAEADAGSGSSVSASSGPSGSSDDEEGADTCDPATATLSTDGFCDELDPATLGAAVQSTKLEKRIEYVAGRTYKDYTGKKFVAPASWCLFSDNAVTDRGNTVSVQLTEASDADIAKALDSYRSSGKTPGYDKSCQVTEETTFGDPGGVAVCTPDKGSTASTSVSAVGLVSGVKFSCSGSMAKAPDAAALESRVREMCSGVLETLAG